MTKAKSTEELVTELQSRLFTTSALKEVSSILEEISQNKTFKLHVNAIMSDNTLTDPQKRRQLSYVLKIIEDPILQEFFDDLLAHNEFWLFTSGKIDYFDKFVQSFQMATEEIELIYLVSAIELDPGFLRNIAEDLSRSFGYKVLIKHEVNPAIIGGIQLRVENLVFDLSIRTKFQQFQRAWLASLDKTENQIGRNQPETV